MHLHDLSVTVVRVQATDVVIGFDVECLPCPQDVCASEFRSPRDLMITISLLSVGNYARCDGACQDPDTTNRYSVYRPLTRWMASEGLPKNLGSGYVGPAGVADSV
jgi:hypothetical protein